MHSFLIIYYENKSYFIGKKDWITNNINTTMIWFVILLDKHSLFLRAGTHLHLGNSITKSGNHLRLLLSKDLEVEIMLSGHNVTFFSISKNWICSVYGMSLFYYLINCVDRESHVYHKMFHSISKTNVRENVVHFAETW